MDSLPVIFVGIIGLASLVWQCKLFVEDAGDCPVRVMSGLVISAIIMIGVIFYSSFLLFDAQVKNYTILSAAKSIGLALVFGFLFTLKSYFGPLVLGYVASYSVYMFFQHDILVIAPIINWLLGLLFPNIPWWLNLTYTVVLGLYLIAVSSFDLVQ
ncbi:hypothetical protein [Candidatus Accumulibacter vicinus]|uniref:Uncharacterized protein n=1 Tax=Candidatus Accumulibacter vicinus TaxID=2954382 RepID=A0A084XWL4_9PROT|nr:hypothetical protein [Candidatus Accumulibacter vicinus]KFB66858.1 MAG: hypothetical protein CAPSK01_003797 [Candidatus Accumulibacter vicinus]